MNTRTSNRRYWSLFTLVILAGAALLAGCHQERQMGYRDADLVEDDYLLRRVPQAVEAKARPLDAIDFVGREPTVDTTDLAADHPDLELTPDTAHTDTLPDFTDASHVMYWVRPGAATWTGQRVIGIVWKGERDATVFYAIAVTP
jgi:hypothetical protein